MQPEQPSPRKRPRHDPRQLRQLAEMVVKDLLAGTGDELLDSPSGQFGQPRVSSTTYDALGRVTRITDERRPEDELSFLGSCPEDEDDNPSF